MLHFPARIALTLSAVGLLAGIAEAQGRERVAFVSVVDRATGKPLDSLAPSDIVIREDRVTREVLRIAPATGPMHVAILVDNSAAAEPAIPDLRGALRAFLDALGDAGPTSIIAMADRPTMLADYTTARDALQQGVARIFSRPDSGATLLEAVLETSRGLAKREGERAAIVVLSVNGRELSAIDASQAFDALAAAGASLHAVVLSPPGRTSFDVASRQRDQLLDRGVRETGGYRRDVLASMAFTPALVELAGTLTHQFRVVYARPQTLIPPDTVVVAATAPGHRAHGAAARGQPR